MAIYIVATPERRRELATRIALSCGWQSLDAMRESVARWDGQAMVLGLARAAGVSLYVSGHIMDGPVYASPESLLSGPPRAMESRGHQD